MTEVFDVVARREQIMFDTAKRASFLCEFAAPLPVLDHGFVRLVDVMGDDAAVVQMARVSYGAGTKTKRTDKGLLNYLTRKRHTTPFEGCEIKLHMRLPIFVARQLVRTRTASLNETSGRYSVMTDDFYVPASADVAMQSTDNRQGRGEPMAPMDAQAFMVATERLGRTSYEAYQADCEKGLSRELARINLGLNYYTEWYWKIDLHNLLNFLQTRMDGHAQLEARRYAEAVAKIVRAWVPVCWNAFEEHRLHGATLSRTELRVVARLLDRVPSLQEALASSDGLPQARLVELCEKLGIEGPKDEGP